MSTMTPDSPAVLDAPPSRATADPVPAPATAQPESASSAATASGGESAGKKAKGKKAESGEGKGKNDKGEGKGKAKDSKPANGAEAGAPSVAAHPRAARAVAQAKGWGGLAGFFIAGYLSLPTGTLAEAGLRALVAGSVCYVVAWAGAVFVWRRLVIIEIKGREQQLLAGAREVRAQHESVPAPVERSRARAAS
jgi:hypothetical protein